MAVDEAMVARHVRAWAQTRFDWPSANCVSSLLSYLSEATGICAPSLRIDDEASARALLATHGGMRRVMGLIAAFFRLMPVGSPICGDIGLIRCGHELIGALHNGQGWARRLPSGVRIGPARHVCVYRIRHV